MDASNFKWINRFHPEILDGIDFTQSPKELLARENTPLCKLFIATLIEAIVKVSLFDATGEMQQYGFQSWIPHSDIGDYDCPSLLNCFELLKRDDINDFWRLHKTKYARLIPYLSFRRGNYEWTWDESGIICFGDVTGSSSASYGRMINRSYPQIGNRVKFTCSSDSELYEWKYDVTREYCYDGNKHNGVLKLIEQTFPFCYYQYYLQNNKFSENVTLSKDWIIYAYKQLSLYKSLSSRIFFWCYFLMDDGTEYSGGIFYNNGTSIRIAKKVIIKNGSIANDLSAIDYRTYLGPGHESLDEIKIILADFTNQVRLCNWWNVYYRKTQEDQPIIKVIEICTDLSGNISTDANGLKYTTIDIQSMVNNVISTTESIIGMSLRTNMYSARIALHSGMIFAKCNDKIFDAYA